MGLRLISNFIDFNYVPQLLERIIYTLRKHNNNVIAKPSAKVKNPARPQFF